MRAVVQKVLEGSVIVEGSEVASIGRGLVCLIGIARDDKYEDMNWLVSKILNGRFFEDEDKMWKKSVKQVGGEVLLVSQFTLHGYLQGTKPDFHRSMGGTEAEAFFNEFIKKMQSEYESDKIASGSFGDMMKVSLTNDGPVTLNLDSRNRQNKDPEQILSRAGQSASSASSSTNGDRDSQRG
eukprot:gb/GECG01003887.1/.p1 GENE.gb/GECG01003887.1/~~gb/GECG01003887.1/.p1  ORF type:complete len:182 (+),score=25.62 gb/GECG01003887.1/:1-546(+)